MAEFQLRRQEMLVVRRCEAEKIQRRLEHDKLQLDDDSVTQHDSSPTVCWILLIVIIE